MANDIKRRDFLKLLGGGAVAASTLLTACKMEMAVRLPVCKNRKREK